MPPHTGSLRRWRGSPSMNAGAAAVGEANSARFARTRTRGHDLASAAAVGLPSELSSADTEGKRLHVALRPIGSLRAHRRPLS